MSWLLTYLTMPLDTSIKSGFITDLNIPPPGTCNLDTATLTSLSLEVALSLLHDFEAFIRSSPLVTAATEIHPSHPKYINVPALLKEFNITPTPGQGDEWIQYEINDKLPLFGGAFSTELIYHTAMHKTPAGFESVTSPGNGVRIHGKFDVVKSSEEGGEAVLNFIEYNETRCNVFLSAYIKATTGSSHREMHERFKANWNDAMKTRLDGLRPSSAAGGGSTKKQKVAQKIETREERVQL